MPYLHQRIGARFLLGQARVGVTGEEFVESLGEDIGDPALADYLRTHKVIDDTDLEQKRQEVVYDLDQGLPVQDAVGKIFQFLVPEEPSISSSRPQLTPGEDKQIDSIVDQLEDLLGDEIGEASRGMLPSLVDGDEDTYHEQAAEIETEIRDRLTKRLLGGLKVAQARNTVTSSEFLSTVEGLKDDSQGFWRYLTTTKVGDDPELEESRQEIVYDFSKGMQFDLAQVISELQASRSVQDPALNIVTELYNQLLFLETFKNNPDNSDEHEDLRELVSRYELIFGAARSSAEQVLKRWSKIDQTELGQHLSDLVELHDRLIDWSSVFPPGFTIDYSKFGRVFEARVVAAADGAKGIFDTLL